MAYNQLSLAKFGFKNSINADEKNNSVCKTKKGKASTLNYEENKRIWTFVASWIECLPSIADSDCGLICCVAETQTSNKIFL